MNPSNPWFAKTFAAGSKRADAAIAETGQCECCHCGAVTHAAERLEVNFYESKLICVACGTVTQRRPRDGQA